MRIIISDSSCLIDLQKASLLRAFVLLPFEVCVPDVIFDNELISFSEKEKQMLIKAGLEILELPGSKLADVQELRRNHPSLSSRDCFACIHAEIREDSILLTGDGDLRRVSEEKSIEVHGVLWALDEIHDAGTATVHQIYSALLGFEEDSTVRLPKSALSRMVKKFEDLL